LPVPIRHGQRLLRRRGQQQSSSRERVAAQAMKQEHALVALDVPYTAKAGRGI
jgi:hypothetical protein